MRRDPKQGPETLPDLISRLAKHGLRDGDIYMAVCCTASRYKPTALAKSGSTAANEWRGGEREGVREVERKE